jgi:hypothetical protein
MTESAEELGHEAERSGAVDTMVRYGLVVYGFLHLVVAWLAVELAVGTARARSPARARSSSSPRTAPARRCWSRWPPASS